jgi:hypothetical protein
LIIIIISRTTHAQYTVIRPPLIIIIIIIIIIITIYRTTLFNTLSFPVIRPLRAADEGRNNPKEGPWNLSSPSFMRG